MDNKELNRANARIAELEKELEYTLLNWDIDKNRLRFARRTIERLQNDLHGIKPNLQKRN